MNLLIPKYYTPIEREYEGWIISCIEEYFRKIDKRVRIFAISPTDEPKFPADEALGFDCKIIGLQFKKASFSPLRSGQTRADFSNLQWNLSSPPAQFPLIKKMNEIFYCLPTFVNRDYKRVGLEHCLFWRPSAKMEATTYWYNNINAHQEYNRSVLADSLRWGGFIERIYSCEIGSLSKSQDISKDIFVKALLSEMNIGVDVGNQDLDSIYIILMEL